MLEKGGFPIIHLWSPESFHDDSYIVGNRDGLLQLKKAIDDALDKKSANTEVFCADGEGYTLKILLTEQDQIACPYTEEYAKGRGIFPWEMEQE